MAVTTGSGVFVPIGPKMSRRTTAHRTYNRTHRRLFDGIRHGLPLVSSCSQRGRHLLGLSNDMRLDCIDRRPDRRAKHQNDPQAPVLTGPPPAIAPIGFGMSFEGK